MDKLRAAGMQLAGPLPADTLFSPAKLKEFDCVLTMYHDQGLIPFKLLAGYSGVNFTAGLPVVRTSPDHGVAYDVAGQNIARIDVVNYITHGISKVSDNPRPGGGGAGEGAEEEQQAWIKELPPKVITPRVDLVV